MKKIVVMGPNPAWQKTLFFTRLQMGEVNRADSMASYAAGKGVNCCRAARCFGAAEPTLVQFCGGPNGELLETALREEKIAFSSAHTSTPTRCCTTLLDRATGSMTELIEPSHTVTASEIDLLLKLFDEAAEDAAGAALCGSLPGKTSPELYHRAAEIARKRGLVLLVDACREIEPLLAAGGRVVLKINRSELESLTRVSGIRAGIDALFGRYPLMGAAITDGGSAAVAGDGKRIVRFALPEIEVTSPLGCGDTATAVTLSEIVNGKTLFEAFRAALGAASANCLSATSGQFGRADADRLADAIVMTDEI